MLDWLEWAIALFNRIFKDAAQQRNINVEHVNIVGDITIITSGDSYTPTQLTDELKEKVVRKIAETSQAEARLLPDDTLEMQEKSNEDHSSDD